MIGDEGLRRLYRRIPTGAFCRDCHECAIRCSGEIRLCRWEWDALCDYIDAEISPEQLAQLVAQDKTLEIEGHVVGRFCILYDTVARRCAVYPVRPLICRLLGHVVFLPCPSGKVPSVLRDGPEIMQQYAALDLRTFAQWSAAAPNRAIAQALRNEEELPSCRS
jgi:hypothetical protein